MRKLISPEEAEKRLQAIFPRAAFDAVLSSPLAGAAVAAFIYIDAVCNGTDDPQTVHWLRPSTVLWLSKDVMSFDGVENRMAWRKAASKNSGAVEDLQKSWGLAFQPAYKDNSRETVRDETFKEWMGHGAIRQRAGLPASSSKGIWALYDHFADLFDPDLADDAFREVAESWRDKHLDPGARLKARHALSMEAAHHAVVVKLPNTGGDTRKLAAGISSEIIKGVVESWSTVRLQKSLVLAISEPGDKVHLGDEKMLTALGIKIDVKKVLPDLIIADIGTEPVSFWIIEAAATGGVVNKQRRRLLLEWAANQNIKPERCSFLTAFRSRNDAAARRHLKDLASGTWAWFADEPGQELAWYQVVPSVDDN